MKDMIDKEIITDIEKWFNSDHRWSDSYEGLTIRARKIFKKILKRSNPESIYDN